MICRICGNEQSETFRAKEMVIGTREVFDYASCPKCSTIQIAEIPSDLAVYYPQNYYSLQQIDNSSRHGKLKSRLLVKRDMDILGIKKTFLGAIMKKAKPASFDSMYLAYAYVYQQLHERKNIRIHDAGCGNGSFLKYFHDLGFTGLSGSDPFLDKDLDYGNYSVMRKELSEIDQHFDVIMLNHVIEHVTDPRSYLKTVFEKLNPNGECLVRTPMSTSVGYESYREHWVGLEPPRHLHIFDTAYFKEMCSSIGFACYEVKYDAIGWHYEASEAYSRGISLNEIPAKNPFTEEQLAQFEAMAATANKANRGDTVAYYLKKK